MQVAADSQCSMNQPVHCNIFGELNTQHFCLGDFSQKLIYAIYGIVIPLQFSREVLTQILKKKLISQAGSSQSGHTKSDSVQNTGGPKSISTLTPFVKPHQVLGYLVLTIVPFFVSETRSKRSRNYSVSKSQGAPFTIHMTKLTDK